MGESFREFFFGAIHYSMVHAVTQTMYGSTRNKINWIHCTTSKYSTCTYSLLQSFQIQTSSVTSYGSTVLTIRTPGAFFLWHKHHIVRSKNKISRIHCTAPVRAVLVLATSKNCRATPYGKNLYLVLHAKTMR